MASNSFLLSTTPHSRLTRKNPNLTILPRRLKPIQAKTASEESEIDESAKPNPFNFKFGKVPDVKSLIPVNGSVGLSFGNARRKDPGTVFVAGAAGQAGVRIAQTLLRQGFSVRAGVPELNAAQELARLATDYKIISQQEAKRLNAVTSTFEDAESIAKAIGNASKVVVTIGPSENGPSSQVTTSDALKVIQAAQLAGVGHVAIVYDGNASSSIDNSVLANISSFFNNIFARTRTLSLTELLEKLVETDVSYTFIKTSLTEDFSPESSYNLVMAAEGSSGTDDLKVAKSQIASLVAGVFSNTTVAENKVVEVSTDPSAPSRPLDDLFSAIPEDGRRKAYAEANAKAKAEEEAIVAVEKAREAAEAAKKLEEEIKKLSEQEARAANLAEEAQEKATAAGVKLGNFMNKAKDISSGISWESLSSQLTNAVQKTQEVQNKVQIATVRGQAKARTLTPNKAVVKSISKPSAPKTKTEPKVEAKKETRKVFGGLFTQETIYIDDE